MCGTDSPARISAGLLTDHLEVAISIFWVCFPRNFVGHASKVPEIGSLNRQDPFCHMDWHTHADKLQLRLLRVLDAPASTPPYSSPSLAPAAPKISTT